MLVERTSMLNWKTRQPLAVNPSSPLGRKKKGLLPERPGQHQSPTSHPIHTQWKLGSEKVRDSGGSLPVEDVFDV